MKLYRLRINRPQGSMGCFAAWAYVTGYWRWALYWQATPKGLWLARSKSVTGKNYPRFGGSLLTPFGTLTLATQPRMDGMKKARNWDEPHLP